MDVRGLAKPTRAEDLSQLLNNGTTGGQVLSVVNGQALITFPNSLDAAAAQSRIEKADSLFECPQDRRGSVAEGSKLFEKRKNMKQQQQHRQPQPQQQHVSVCQSSGARDTQQQLRRGGAPQSSRPNRSHTKNQKNYNPTTTTNYHNNHHDNDQRRRGGGGGSSDSGSTGVTSMPPKAHTPSSSFPSPVAAPPAHVVPKPRRLALDLPVVNRFIRAHLKSNDRRKKEEKEEW